MEERRFRGREKGIQRKEWGGVSGLMLMKLATRGDAMYHAGISKCRFQIRENLTFWKKSGKNQ